VHEHAAVGLEHEQAGAERKVRAQPARVVDGAFGYDEAHLPRVRGRLTAESRGRLAAVVNPAG